MSHPLDYEAASARTPSRAVAFIAYLLALYPLVVLALLYGEWLLAWWMLGHPPRPSLDDPKSIAVASQMHLLTALALMSLLPAGWGAVVATVVDALSQRLPRRSLLIRAACLLAPWMGTFILLRSDPGRVLYWWFH